MTGNKTACLLLADGFEETEALVTWDFLVRAGVTVTAVGVATAHAHHGSGAHGVKVVLECQIADVLARTFDVIVCPGGMPGSATLGNSAEVKEMIKRHIAEKKYIAAICAAPALVLAQNGLFPDGVKGVCYPGMEDKMGKHHIQRKEHDYNVDGHFITAKGPSAAINFARAICKAMGLESEADKVYKAMWVSPHAS